MSKNKLTRRKKILGAYPYGTVIFSISLSLFVIGLFGLLVLRANKLSSVIKQNIEMHVYLHNNIEPDSLEKIRSKIASYSFVDVSNNIKQIKFISKEEAAEVFIKETGEDFNQILSENPLRASYVVKINPIYFESRKLKEIATIFSDIEGVYEVDYPVNLIEEINKNIKILSMVLISLAIFLIITTALLINNTIKLALFSQRFLIRSMQLVGATPGFIQSPFLKRSAVQGMISGVIACVLLFFTLQYAYNHIPDLKFLQDIEAISALFGGIIVLGLIIGLYSSYRAIKKYLKMSLDDLY